mgnify:CR=1 FL=1
MWLLLGTTITASFFDSLNPSAIAQQMLLQAMVKQKRHTLYFILGIGIFYWYYKSVPRENNNPSPTKCE